MPITDLEFQVNAYVGELLKDLETHHSIIAVVPNKDIKEMIRTKIPIAVYYRIQIVNALHEGAIIRPFNIRKQQEEPDAKGLHNGEKEA